MTGKSKLKTFFSNLLPEYAIFPLAFAWVWNCVAYWGGRLIGQNLPHRMFITELDEIIPFLPWSVTIYVLTFLFWAVNYTLASRRDEEQVYRFLFADFITRTVCLVTFILLPTTNIRPEITGNGFFDWGMSVIYALDSPDNLLPSIHCTASTMAALGIATDKIIPKWYRITSFVIATAICISTLTTKQHVIIDVATGVGLAFIAYAIAGNKKMKDVYIKLILSLKAAIIPHK